MKIPSSDYVIGYARFPDGERIGARGSITDWHGNTISEEATITSRWKLRNSWQSDSMFQIWARIDGVWYTGRGMGDGMIWKGKRSMNQ